MASDHGNKAPAATTSSSSRPPSDQHQVVVVKCPRCDSPNTKFCYYNNYSLTQPRHFCKTCRRYWTKGGALRNVPIGGGCRKSKKLKSSSSSSSTSTSTLANSTTSSSSTTSELGGFKFFHHAGGLNSPPSMDFNLKDLSLMPSPPPPATGMINYNLQSQFSFDSGASLSAAPPLGFSLEPSSLTASGAYPMMMMIPGGGRGGNGNGTAGLINGSMNVNTSLASSIESLSCMNQDLHWKLQQQRLSLLFGDNTTAPKEDGGGGMPRQHADDDGGQQQQQQPEKPQPILFRDLGEIRTDSKQHEVVGGGGGKGDGEAATEWFFGNSYGQVVGSGCGAGAGSASAAPAATVAGTPSNSSSNSNWNGSNGGVQAWGDLNPYTTSLP